MAAVVVPAVVPESAGLAPEDWLNFEISTAAAAPVRVETPLYVPTAIPIPALAESVGEMAGVILLTAAPVAIELHTDCSSQKPFGVSWNCIDPSLYQVAPVLSVTPVIVGWDVT